MDWLARRGRIGIGGVDTRRLTRAIRQQGAPHVALAHDPAGNFDIAALVAKARAWSGLVGLDLAKDVTCAQSYRWDETRWAWPGGYGRRDGAAERFKVELDTVPARIGAVTLAIGPERVALGDVVGDGVDRLAGVVGQDLVQARAHAQDLARMDIDVGGLALEAAQWLVDHHP